MYILKYDFTPLTINLNRGETEHRKELFDKFEDLLSEYRRVVNLEDFLGNPAAENIHVYKVKLDNELQLDEFLD